MQPQLFLEEIEICDQDGYHKILKDENQTPVEHIFFNAVGGKNACMIVRACMIKSNNIVNDQTLQIKPFLAYEDFQIVNDQNVLEVKELTQDNNGYFTVKFRINEVSSHHQGQKFRLMLTIDNFQNDAISPIFSTPIEVRSKIVRRSFDTDLSDSTPVKRVKKMNKTVTFQPTLSFIDPTSSTNPMLSIPLIDMMSIKDISAGVIEQVTNLKKFITVIESSEVFLNARSIQVYNQCTSKILNDMNQLNSHLSKCFENNESLRNSQRQGLSHSDVDDLCKAPILSRQNSQNSYVIPVEYENNNANDNSIINSSLTSVQLLIKSTFGLVRNLCADDARKAVVVNNKFIE